MKKCTILFFVFVLGLTFLAGCQNTAETQTADFSFPMPDGFALSEITDTSCSIVSNETVVGGITLTELRAKDLTSEPHSDAFYHYMDFVCGSDFISEYIVLGTADKELVDVATQKVTNPETGEVHNYQRLFFVRNASVYDMWFDMEVMEESAVKEFYPANQG